MDFVNYKYEVVNCDYLSIVVNRAVSCFFFFFFFFESMYPVA